MRCPYCGGENTQVKDSRPTEENAAIRRRRICPDCGGRFTTFERVQLREITRRQALRPAGAFDRDKLSRSVEVALRKRPIDRERIERMVSGIVRQLESTGERRCRPRRSASLVMEALSGLDPVAYVRFASVYRDFREAADFHEVLGEIPPSGPPGRDEAAAHRPSARRRDAPSRSIERSCALRSAPVVDVQDRRFMQIALRHGACAGSAARRPTRRSARSSPMSARGEMIARGWTQPGGRPHAETEAMARAGDARAGPDHVRHARAVLALRHDAAVCRRHRRGRHSPRRVRHRGSRSARRRARASPAAPSRRRGRARPVAEAAHWIAAGHILRVTERRPFVQLKLARAGDGLSRGGEGSPRG